MRSGLVADSLAVGAVDYSGRGTAVAAVVGRIGAAVEDMGRSHGCRTKVLVSHCVPRLAHACICQKCLILTNILAVPVGC